MRYAVTMLLTVLLLGGLLQGAAAPAQAGEDDARMQAWYERIEKELADLERRLAGLTGAGATEAQAKQVDRGLARALLDLTKRMMALEKRLAGLEKTGPAAAGTAPASGTAGPAGSAKDAPSVADAPGAAGAAKKKPGPAFLDDPAVVKQIPKPAKTSKVRIVRTKSGLRKGVIDLPKGSAGGPYGKLPCTPGAEVFLVQDAPVIGLELTIVNRMGYLFEEETSVFLRVDGNTTECAMKWSGSTVTVGERVLYVETLNFGTGLPTFLQMINGSRVTVLVGACEFVIEKICMAALRDLCSVLHPDRIDALRR